MHKVDEIMKIIYDWDRELSIKEQDLPIKKRKTAAARADLFRLLEPFLEPDGPDLDID